MEHQILNDWNDFLKNLGVQPPEFLNSLSIEQWCPPGTMDNVRIRQGRPALVKLLSQMKEYALNPYDYPQWASRPTFQKLVEKYGQTKISLDGWIKANMKQISLDDVYNSDLSKREELFATFDEISRQDEQLFEHSMKLYETYISRKNHVNSLIEINQANPTQNTNIRLKMLNDYVANVLEPQIQIIKSIEEFRSLLEMKLKDMVLELIMNALDSIFIISFPDISDQLDEVGKLIEDADPNTLQTNIDLGMYEKQIQSTLKKSIEEFGVTYSNPSMKIQPRYDVSNPKAPKVTILFAQGDVKYVEQNTTINSTPTDVD